MKFLLLLSAMVAIAAIASAETDSSRERILSAHPDQVFFLQLPGKQFLATINNRGSRRIPRDVLSIWIEEGNAYHLLNKVAAGVGSFDEPHAFTINGYDFIYAPTVPSGSGGFVQEHIFWIASDGTSHPVEFRRAAEIYEERVKPGQIVIGGGERDFFFEDGRMKFQFWLAREEDPHCCPSMGTVTGTYKIVSDGSLKGPKIEVDEMLFDEGIRAALH